MKDLCFNDIDMKLLLKNFRSHKKLELELSPVTIILGPNGSGKTNVLEALSFLSAARSFRAEDKRNLIKDGADFATIQLADFEVVISRAPRLMATFKIKGVKQRIYDFVGQLPSVIFTPESLAIISGSPADRRRFMDGLLSQLSGDYFRALVNYKKVIVRRNHLLSKIANREATERELDFWDESLAFEAEKIIKERQVLTDYFSQQLPRYYHLFSNKKEAIKLLYKEQVRLPVLKQLRDKRAIEIGAQTTIFGPHRDDLLIMINDYLASNYASRGELRSLVLALKLAEINYLGESKAGQSPPILLLDDVFSELDSYHREQIEEMTKNYMTVITTTDLDHIAPGLAKSATIIKLN